MLAPETKAEPAPIKSLVANDGLIICLNDAVLYNDTDLNDEECAALADIGRRQSLNGQFATDSVQRFVAQDEGFRARASGLLYTTTGSDLGRGRLEVMWVRAEQAGTVTWAGRPEKIESEVDGQVRISPRKSFEAWSTQTEGHARPWTSPDSLVSGKLMVRVMTGDRPRP